MQLWISQDSVKELMLVSLSKTLLSLAEFEQLLLGVCVCVCILLPE
jgi:hypothetical protein